MRRSMHHEGMLFVESDSASVLCCFTEAFAGYVATGRDSTMQRFDFALAEAAGKYDDYSHFVGSDEGGLYDLC